MRWIFQPPVDETGRHGDRYALGLPPAACAVARSGPVGLLLTERRKDRIILSGGTAWFS